MREGADVSIVYYDEDTDAQETAKHIKKLGGKCLLIKGDLNDPAFAKMRKGNRQLLRKIPTFDKQSCGSVYVQQSILDISDEQLSFIFIIIFFPFSISIKAALPYLKKARA